MVAEMENYGAASHLEEGDGQIPASDQKDALTESGSENTGTSTEESSEEDEDEEGDEEEDECPAEVCAEKDKDREPGEHHVEGSSDGSNAGPEPEGSKGIDEMYVKPCCERCKAIPRSHGNELVTPRRICEGRRQLLRVQLEGEGTYECSLTGLVFEVSERVQLQYSVLSWSKFGTFLTDSWRLAGPIFNVDTVTKDASVLKSIQFPHSLCLAEPDAEMTFSVLHVKHDRPAIEPTVDHSGSHVKWHVSSLSPVGPVFRTSQSESVHDVPHHGVVLIYKDRECSGSSNNNSSFSFRIYLATNNSSDIKDIRKAVCGSKRRYMKVEKPPTCKLNGRRYRLMSEPDGEIKPEHLDFTPLAVVPVKGYFEAFFEQPPPFNLSLVETDTDQTVWSATIREGDCVDRTVKNPKKASDSRKRSSSTSEEELHNSKRPRWRPLDESDGLRAAQRRCQQEEQQQEEEDISEKQLLQVAKRLGKEWKQAAIFLDLSSVELDDIQASEKDVTMQKHRMLVTWKSRRRPGQATVAALRHSLKDLDDLPNEVHHILDTWMDK